MKKTKWPRPKLIFLTIFFGVHTLSHGSTQAVSNIEITDFKYFRKITYDGNQILLLRDLKNKGIHFLSGAHQMAQIKIKGNEQLTFKTSDSTKHFKLSFVKNKLNLNIKNKSIYFLDNTNQKSLCEQRRLSYTQQLTDINFKLDEIKIEKLMDIETCSGVSKSIMLRNLQNTLGEKANSLNLCMEKESLKNLFYKDSNFQRYIGSVYSKYLKLIDQISDDKTPLKIKCVTADKEKLGSFDESTNPATMSVNYPLLREKYSEDSALGKAIEETLHHELSHFGDQLGSADINNHNCVDETYANIFTKLCDKNLTVMVLPTSSEIEEKCEKNEKNNVVTSANSSTIVGNRILNVNKSDNSTTASAANQNNDYNNQQNIKNVDESSFGKVDDSELAKLLSPGKPNVRYGEKYTVSEESTIGSAAIKTIENLKNKSFSLANRVIAATTNPAQANLIGASKPNIGTTSNPRESLPTSLSTTSTSLVKKTGDTFAASTKTTNLNTESASTISNNTNSRMPAAEKTSAPAENTQRPSGVKGQPSEMASSASGSVTKNSVGTTAAITNPSIKPATNTNKAVVSIASDSAQQQTLRESAAIFEAIRNLKTFNEMSGEERIKVQKLYNNEFFKNLLNVNGMSIRIEDGNGSRVIGKELSQKSKVFNDNGKILKVESEVKK